MFFWRRRADPGLAAVLLKLREDLAAERAARAFAMQRLAEVKLEHARQVEDLRRRLAISQANFEWLSVTFNKNEAERAQLLLARAGVATSPLVVAVDDRGSGLPRELGDPPPTPAVERPYQNQGTPNLADLNSQGLSFDDVGEREARALGLDQGEVYDATNPLFT